MARSVAYAVLAFNLFPNISRTVPLGGAAPSAWHFIWPVSLGFVCVVLPPLVLAIYDTHADTIAKPHLLRTRIHLAYSLTALAFVWYVSVALGAGEYVLGPTCPYHNGGGWWRFYHSIPIVFWNALFIYLVLAAISYALAVLQVSTSDSNRAPSQDEALPSHSRLPCRQSDGDPWLCTRAQVYGLVGARYLLRLLQRTRDYLLHACLMTILCCLSALVLPHFMQKRMLFQPSPLFFSRRWFGDLQALGWFVLLFPVGLIGLLLYLMLFTMLGQSTVMSLDPFQCS